jgi:ATP-dependent helicase/DNAse subunit B
MAEHVRNQLARAHLPIRPNRILTLAKFLEPFTEFQEAPESLLHLLIAQSDLSNFASVAEFPAFHRALAVLVGQVPDLPPALVQIADNIDHQLALRNRALRDKRVRTAKPVTTGPIVIDGFFTFSPAELDLIEKLAAQTSVTVTLPDWPGSSSAQARLLSSGFAEERLDRTLREPRHTVFAAPTMDQEVEQIALRILEHARQGRAFREIAIILRVRDPYAPALETMLARFGIPARFHFADELAAHPAIQYLSGIVRTMLSGWNHADLLTLLRMPVSGIGATPEGDALDFEMRESLPAAGIENFVRQCGARPPACRVETRLDTFANSLVELSQALNRRDRLTPIEWVARLKTLRNLLPLPEITDQINHEQLQILRSTAAALEAFDAALDTTALALNETKLPLAAFWPRVEAALSIEKLRVPDHRRNVVNVLDVYEARQWELPIVFVCGLTERHFPRYHREDPLLPDPARTQALQDEERFLYQIATTRATEETVQSYARYNDKGDAQLRSFFLEQEGEASSPARAVVKTVGQVPDLPTRTPDLKKLHAKLAPTSIESFLQCPFQFFAKKTLKLRQRPLKPRERLDVLVQGSILHKALAEYSRAPMFGASWIDRVFEDECDKENIPRTYRREAVRLELLRHFEAFLADKQWPLEWPGQTEQEFLVAISPELSIRGRIDRLDRGPKNEAIVIDYKYSAAAKIRERIKDADSVQAGIYLLAAERFFHLQPAGMFFCGLRQSVTWDGWHAGVPGLAIGESRTSSGLRELIEGAEQRAKETFESIAAGNMEVRPADRDKCRYCDFNDICRIESLPRTEAAPS